MESTEVLLPPCLVQPFAEISDNSTNHVKTSEPVSCPWGKIIAPESISFNDVMSEQLATVLHEDETNFLDSENSDLRLRTDISAFKSDTDDQLLCDDQLLAQMLQLEFDKEHDNILKLEESKYNGSSKVTVSFEKYRRRPEACVSSEEEEEDYDYAVEQRAKTHWGNFVQAEKTFQAIGKSGVYHQGNTTTTKHDLTVSARRNAEKLMKLSTGISTGDGGNFDMKISNTVFNSLRTYSITEDKRKQRQHDKMEKSTAERALDEKTHLILFKLINNQILESISGCISTGKEACIFHAWSGMPPDKSLSPELALKVFKTSLNEFQKREQYIRDDYRFRHRFSKQNPRKIVHLWAEKEMRNLLRMKLANINCPEVVELKKHVLAMTFIGKNEIPAPKIKDVNLSFVDMTIAYEQVLEIMKIMYSKCKLVHADLSEYNLLWHEEKVWVIDVSQAVDIKHSQSMDFLLRDCRNMSTFFENAGIKVLTPEEMFTAITGKVASVA